MTWETQGLALALPPGAVTLDQSLLSLSLSFPIWEEGTTITTLSASLGFVRFG